MANLQIFNFKQSKSLSFFTIFMVAGFIALTSVHGQGFNSFKLDLAIPATYQVELSAPSTPFSGTSSRIWFRLYSDDKGAWGAWHSIKGLAAGASKSVTASEAPNFTNPSRVLVFEGQNDGVRLNISVSNYALGTLYSSPSNQWVKNGFFQFDLIPDVTYEYVQPTPSSSLCDEYLEVSDGFLCAIRPSRIDAEARDIYGPTEDDATHGFGYHVIAFPNTSFNPQKVLFHLGGSLGRPFDQDTSEFSARAFLEESLSSGYIVVQPAYHNRYPINGPDECGGNSDINDCAGLVRLEKIRGSNETDVIEVPVADSIERRIVRIFEYFSSEGFDFPAGIVDGNTVSWDQAAYGGHSQGSGHALYIGKNFGGQSVCIIGGVSDVADDVPLVPEENIADWLLDNQFEISTSKIRGFLIEEDPFYDSFTSTLTLLGISYSSASNPPYTNYYGESIGGHAASIHDPQFSDQRAFACFQ